MALVEHLEKLRHLLKISQFNSINEAAANTGLSQAGLSKSLILLEQELGCKLFNRSREGLVLTPEGSEVLLSAKKIVAEATDVENRLRSIKAISTPRTVRVGMYDSIIVYFGIELQKYLASVYPKVKMTLHSDSSAGLKQKIMNSELDIAIGVNFSTAQCPKLNYVKLFDDQYSYYVSSKFKTQVSELPVMIYDGATDETGNALGKILAKDLRGKTVHTIQHFETLKALTHQGLGIGVMPTQVALPLVSQKELVNVHFDDQRQLFGRHQIGILVRTEIQKSFQEFIDDIIRLGTRKLI